MARIKVVDWFATSFRVVVRDDRGRFWEHTVSPKDERGSAWVQLTDLPEDPDPGHRVDTVEPVPVVKLEE